MKEVHVGCCVIMFLNGEVSSVPMKVFATEADLKTWCEGMTQRFQLLFNEGVQQALQTIAIRGVEFSGFSAKVSGEESRIHLPGAPHLKE